MDFNINTNNNYKAPGSNMASVAMILGIGAIVTALMMTVYFPFILGSIAIVLALLSKGSFAKMQSKAKAGIICSVIALLLNFGIIGYSFNIIFHNPDLIMDTAIMYDEMIEEMYGIPAEELLGESMEDAISDMYQMFE